MTCLLTSLSVAAETPSGWEDLANLFREYANNDLAEPHLSTIWQDLIDLTARYAAPQGGAVLLRVDQTLAGCVAFTSTRIDGVCEVKRLYVRKAFRRQGWGSLLLKDVLKQARDAGYAHAVLSTWPDNPKALELYAAMGFVPVPSFKEHSGQRLVFLGYGLASLQTA